MDPVHNPYAPGAGTPPPNLAGRDSLREDVRVCIERLRLGNPAKSILMVGLRGMGKTVLLDQMKRDADAANVQTARMEAPEGRSLPALLAPQLRQGLLRLSRIESVRDAATRALRALAGFATALKLKYADIEVGIDVAKEAGLADNGDLELDLATLLEEVGKAAAAAESVFVMFIDELQYVGEDQFAALISALHRCAQQKLPVCVVGAGLPQLRGRAGNAKSYAERLFNYPEVGPLSEAAARQALVKPAADRQVEFTERAVQRILDKTQGYPYFLQEWGKHAWDVAIMSPIREEDVDKAELHAIAALDESFFRVRFDRLTPSQKRYLRAMADLGAGPHRSGDIAEAMKKHVSQLGPARSELIAKGMIWSPSHGDTAFTVPLFHEFMKRIMPGDDWERP